MADLPVVGAQLTALNLAAHRDWLFEKDRDVELAEYAMPDILRAPEPFIDRARAALDGWKGRLGVHGPFRGFEIDVSDREIRGLVQARLTACLDACAALGAVQMVLHSPFDAWDHANLGRKPRDRERRVAAIAETLAPALTRAEGQGVTLVLENIRDVDPAERAAVLAAAGSTALKLSVDTGHAEWAYAHSGAPHPARFIAAAGESLAHVHLQDTDGSHDCHWPLGEGRIDFPAIFAELARVPSRPHLIVEINDFSRIKDSVAYLEKLGLAQ